MWASRSNHSERSATVEASRDRSTATAARSTAVRRNAAWSSLSGSSAAQTKSTAPRLCSIPPRPTISGYAIAAASAISARSRAAAVNGWSARGDRRDEIGLGGLVEPDREGELGIGPVRVLEADRRARRADGCRSGAHERLERLVEVGAAGQRLGTGGKRREGIGSPGHVVGHGLS